MFRGVQLQKVRSGQNGQTGSTQKQFWAHTSKIFNMAGVDAFLWLLATGRPPKNISDSSQCRSRSVRLDPTVSKIAA